MISFHRQRTRAKKGSITCLMSRRKTAVEQGTKQIFYVVDPKHPGLKHTFRLLMHEILELWSTTIKVIFHEEVPRVQVFLVLHVRGRGEGKAVSFLLKADCAWMWFFMMVQMWTGVSKEESPVSCYKKFHLPLISDTEDQARKVHWMSQQGTSGRDGLLDPLSLMGRQSGKLFQSGKLLF